MKEKILAAIKDKGGKAATWVIANSIGMRGKTSKVLITCKQLEHDKVLERHHHSTRNNYVWMKRCE